MCMTKVNDPTYTRNMWTTFHQRQCDRVLHKLKEDSSKGDRTKHIPPKFFYTRELQKKCEIDVQQIQSCNNLADLFTKALPSTTLKKLRYDIGVRRLRDLPFEMLKKS